MKKIYKYEEFLESSKTMLDIIPQSVKDLHELFKAGGKKLYLVGGAVRDFLTGDKPKDFDLATDALPDEVLGIIGDKYRTNLQGKAFGVVVVFTKDQPEGMEIATFREDTSKGRNPEVKLGVTIEQDVRRRDISFNGLFFDLDTNEIVDLVGGQQDLKDGVTRMIGDPSERFEKPARELGSINRRDEKNLTGKSMGRNEESFSTSERLQLLSRFLYQVRYVGPGISWRRDKRKSGREQRLRCRFRQPIQECCNRWLGEEDGARIQNGDRDCKEDYILA